MISSTVAAVESRYGKIFQVGKNGKITRFNEQGAAALFALTNDVVFALEEGSDNIYNPATGCYELKSREEMLSQLDLFIHRLAVEIFDEDALEDKRKQSVLSSMLKFLPSICGKRNFFPSVGQDFYSRCQRSTRTGWLRRVGFETFFAGVPQPQSL